MNSYSENALMLKVKEGELDKLGLLFERYHRRLYRYFYRLTGRREVSEDLVQGVFERILKYRHSYSDANGYAFSTWIYRIARNLHADYRRNRQQAEDEPDLNKLPANGNDQLPQQDPSPEPEWDVDEAEEDPRLQWLEEAINRLDDEKKETLVLSRYQGFKYREIAEIMNCSESAVKVRIYRAMNELRDMMNERRNKEEL